MTDTSLPAAARPASFRWRTAGIHLGITLVVVGMLAMQLRTWFPGLLFPLDGGRDALLLLAATALLAGPLLTVFAAAPGKSTRLLRLDFTVIGLVQSAVIAAGLAVVHDQRPAALVWCMGRIYAQPWSAFDNEPAARQWLLAQPGKLPVRVQVALPENPGDRQALFDQAAARRSWIGFNASLYVPYAATSADVRAYSARLAAAVHAAGFDDALAAAGVDMQAVAAGRVLLATSLFRSGDYWLTIDPQSGEILSTTLALPLNRTLNRLGGIT